MKRMVQLDEPHIWSNGVYNLKAT